MLQGIQTALSHLRELNQYRRKYADSWGEALRTGIDGYERFESLQRDYEERRDLHVVSGDGAAVPAGDTSVTPSSY